MKQTHFSRRGFIRAGIVGAGMAAVGVSGVSPNEKLNIAAIGVGGQGAADLGGMASENIVGLCDVDAARAAGTFQRFGNARRFVDYRRMFDAMEREIDAVLVATPDHFHSVAALEAIGRGKHVYCEKPLAHSIYEVRALMKAAQGKKVVTQLGNQGHSYDSIRVFREWIEDGVIGNVREVHAMCASVYSRIEQLEAVKKGEAVPAGLDWDLWLGPARWRPYHSAYVPGKWRAWSAFGTGVIGDWTCHVVDPVFWALDLGAPTSVFAETGDFDPAKHGETFPKASRVTFEFPAKGARPGVKLVWHDGANKPERPKELDAGEELPGIGALVIGDKGKIVYGSHGAGQLRILDEAKMASVSRKPTRIARSPGHQKEWIEACKAGKAAGSDFAYGGPLTEVALLGVIAIQCKGERLEWDSKGMRFTNSSRANGFIQPEFRAGWRV